MPFGSPEGSSVYYMCIWQYLTTQWVLSVGKPLIISEFGMWRTMAARNEVFQALYEELLSAKNSGLPVAGAVFPCLAADVLADQRVTTRQRMPWDSKIVMGGESLACRAAWR